MNKKIEDLQKSLSLKITKLKYQKKCKKLNISLDMFNYLINIAGIEKEEVKDILKIISKSESPLEFKNNIINYCKNKKKVVYAQSFLLGTITGNYPFCDFVSIWLRDEFNFDNFVNLDPQVIDILKEKFYEYIINDNKLKNNFLINKDGVRDYTVDLNKEFCDKIFDEVISGNFDIKSDEFNNLKKCYDITINYILETIGIYGQETIKNNFDFIMYDINKNSTETLENRKKSYMIKSSLRNDQIEKIDNINILIKRLKSINKKDAFDLLERLKIAIQDPVKNISEIEDIYLEFEVLFRQEIVETLFKPTEEYTLVENFTDIRPQLIHFFLRDFVANFMDGKVENLKKEIIIASILIEN